MTDSEFAQDTTPPPGWEGLLEDGERILWQGDASARIRFGDLISLQSIFGVFFAGFAIFWMTTAASIGGRMNGRGGFGFESLFPLFGLPFLFIGLYQSVGRIFFDAYKRSTTHYTLTTRAAYVATSTFGTRKLDRIGLDEMNSLNLEDGSPGTVWFGERRNEVTYRSKHGHRRTRIQVTKLGFREIDEPRVVYGLLRDARNAAEEAEAE